MLTSFIDAVNHTDIGQNEAGKPMRDSIAFSNLMRSWSEILENSIKRLETNYDPSTEDIEYAEDDNVEQVTG